MEVSKRNGETVLVVLREQDLKIQEQQKRIDLLNMAFSNLTQKVIELESMLMIQKVKLTGHGATANNDNDIKGTQID